MIDTWSANSEPTFIAEIGINHNGNLDLAKELIGEAKESGADIVKFQTHIPDDEMIPSHPLYGIISECSFDVDQERELFNFCYKLGILFMSTPFSIAAVHRLADLGVSVIKTGSGELTHTPLQLEVAAMRLPTFISTGMSTMVEIRRTVQAVTEINPNIILMSCCSLYPSKPEYTNLKKLELLRMLTPLVGQSDHSESIGSALGAIALGAVAIEKHFTTSKIMKGPDHMSSVTPKEFKQLTTLGREIYLAARDEARSEYLPEEESVREWAHHFLVTKEDVRAGELLSNLNVTFKRVGPPVDGLISPQLVPNFRKFQARFKWDFEANHPIIFADLDSHS